MNTPWPRWPASGSTVATTTWTSAIPPLPMNTLWPSITQSSPSRRARVWIERMSEPPLGSVTASAASLMSPGVPKHSGAQRTSCSSVAACRIAASASAGITIDSPIPAHPQNSSSIRIGSDSPVGSTDSSRVQLPAVQAVSGRLLEHRPRETPARGRTRRPPDGSRRARTVGLVRSCDCSSVSSSEKLIGRSLFLRRHVIVDYLRVMLPASKISQRWFPHPAAQRDAACLAQSASNGCSTRRAEAFARDGYHDASMDEIARSRRDLQADALQLLRLQGGALRRLRPALRPDAACADARRRSARRPRRAAPASSACSRS